MPSVDFTHTDYTDELNRIIVALTGIRDDVRLLRKVMEDPNQGAVTSHVMNDIQKALLAVAISNNGAANAEAIRKQIKEVGVGEVMNTKVGKDGDGTTQENIDKIVIGPPVPDDEVVDPSISDKRWPPVRSREKLALPNANSSSDIFNPATGIITPLTKDAQKIAMQQSGNKGVTPPAAAGSKTIVNQTERHAILVKLNIPTDDEALMKKVLIRVSGKYYWEVEGADSEDDGRFGTFPVIEKYAIDRALGDPLGYQSKTGSAGEDGKNYVHDAEARSSLGAVADPRTTGPQ